MFHIATTQTYNRRGPAPADGRGAVRRKQRLSDNRLLALLPAAERDALAPSLEWTVLPPHTPLYEPGRPLGHAYLPTQGVISILYHGRARAQSIGAELAVVGPEGILGVALVMGGETTPSRALTRTWWFGYRFPAAVLQSHFSACSGLRRTILRYTEALITQCSLNAVCYLHHATEQQLCRWLLHNIDRSGSNSLDTTTALMGEALGVRRQTVAAAAEKLARVRLISHSPGRIRVLDKARLALHSCECYGIVRREVDRLLGTAAAL